MDKKSPEERGREMMEELEAHRFYTLLQNSVRERMQALKDAGKPIEITDFSVKMATIKVMQERGYFVRRHEFYPKEEILKTQ